MVNYTCYCCNYTTNRKSSMENHFNRKNICISKHNNIKLNNSIKKYILQGLSYVEYKELIDNIGLPETVTNLKELKQSLNDDILISKNNFL